MAKEPITAQDQAIKILDSRRPNNIHNFAMQVPDIMTLNLNDSEIIEVKVTIDYSVEILIKLILDYETQETALHKMTFTDCRAANLNLNLGYDGPNSILRGEQKMVDSGFVDYEIETNTTASFIRVSARTLHLERLP
jgi:hypothetical protein